VTGEVVAVGARRGRSEVQVEVRGVGRLTALGPVGWTALTGEPVDLRVDPGAIARLP
jgi:thiamine transport system ATP-binding protein